eukprot:m.264952 g.264952  ORF g.264952 m.264952 type:complete len:56 (+) comp100805_c0_seq1:67-234(+)
MIAHGLANGRSGQAALEDAGHEVEARDRSDLGHRHQIIWGCCNRHGVLLSALRAG